MRREEEIKYQNRKREIENMLIPRKAERCGSTEEGGERDETGVETGWERGDRRRKGERKRERRG